MRGVFASPERRPLTSIPVVFDSPFSGQGVEECRLSLPLEVVVDVEAATLTIRQSEAAR